MKELRRLALKQQGLASSRPFGNGIDGTRRAIEHLGYLQIDTLSVVERAHHHILWTRVPDYEPSHLSRLVQDRHVFEYWFHAASYLPMRDYRFFLPRMAAIRSGVNRYFRNVDERLMSEILDRVRIEGPLRVRDIEKRRTESGSWWNWGPGRRAVDKLFMQGDLMVRGRNGMERVFDLTERIVPSGIDLREPTLAEYAAYLIDSALRAHGVVTVKQLVHLQTGKTLKEMVRRILAERVEDGSIVLLKTSGLSDAYVERDALERIARGPFNSVRLLSPFDNVVIHRERLSQLFGFDYRLECYLPAAKRVFGYFCLPILIGDRLAGRADCKAHRAEGRFEVLSVHVEDKSVDKGEFRLRIGEAVQRLAALNGCSTVEFRT